MAADANHHKEHRMKIVRIIAATALAGLAAFTLTACGNQPASPATTNSATAATTVASEPVAAPAPVTVTAPAPVTVTAPPAVTVTAPPPVIVTQAAPPPVVIVPDPSTVYPGYYCPPGADQCDPNATGVTTLPSGLFCRDLHAMGYNWNQAITYWNYWGQPDRMDADLNGIPCETVY
jgi:hypothetical protein